MDPVTTAKLAEGFMGTAGAAMAGGPSQASSGFDGSGWNVNFGGGNIDSNRNPPTVPSVPGVANMMPYAIAAMALLMVWKLARK